MRPTVRALFAAAGLAAAAPALAQSTITLFGQEYNVVRFNYFERVQWPSPTFAGETLQLFESEGITMVGNNRLLMTADDIADLFPGDPDNWVVEVELVVDGSGTPTDLRYTRTIAAIDSAAYDPNPGGVTINRGNTGLGAGGNVIVAGNEGYLFAYSFQTSTLGQLLPWPPNSGCLPATGSCNMDLSVYNTNAEDAVFVPASGTRPDAFYVINQDLAGLDSAGLEIWSTTGTRLASFVTGGTVDAGLFGAVAKGVTYLPDSPATPANIRRPGGTILVSFDRDFPALQAFTVDGQFIATEYLTTNQRPTGTPRLDNSGCSLRPHIESLAFDPQTGRLFLNNQGNFSSCNWLWVLTPATPIATGCVSDYNRDTFLNLDDLGDFITDYYTVPAIPAGLQPNAPTYSDVATIGFGTSCPLAPNAPAPYGADAYRANGYRVGYSSDGSNNCPLDPSQPFPNLDNLNDFITLYYSEFGTEC